MVIAPGVNYRKFESWLKKVYKSMFDDSSQEWLIAIHSCQLLQYLLQELWSLKP